ncbi:MAG: DUF4190 domain-containing protein [Hungatella sp.]|nr:DUF4190 domain-containing protein [Hungatella sp.]
MDEYRNQNPDQPNDPLQAPPDSSYNSHISVQQEGAQNQGDYSQRPPEGQADSQQRPDGQNQQQWQNSQNPQQQWQNNQNPQQQWQSNQTPPQQQWQGNQNLPHQQWQNQQQYWQNNGPGGQQYWSNGQPGSMPYPQPPKQRNNMALASMIFGILSLLACCIPFIQFPLAVVAIVLVILSKKKQPFSGFAIAGLVMGIISIVISILMTLYWGTVLSMMNDPEFMDIYNEMLKTYQ